MAAPNFADKTIWTGDNLDILRGMNSECVELIYLDPPFNSNKTYAAPARRGKGLGSKARAQHSRTRGTYQTLTLHGWGL